MRTAFAPTAEQLLARLNQDLLHVLSTPPPMWSKTPDGRFPVVWLPLAPTSPLPAGLHTGRTKVALASLSRQLQQLFTAAARIGRYPGVVLFEVEAQEIVNVGSGIGDAPEDGSIYVRLTVRGANLRPTYAPVLAGKDGARFQALDGSVSADESRLTGVFRVLGSELPGWLEATTGKLPTGLSVVLPAESVPIEIVDAETGTPVSAPPVRVWPDYTPLQDLVAGRHVNWSATKTAAFTHVSTTQNGASS